MTPSMHHFTVGVLRVTLALLGASVLTSGGQAAAAWAYSSHHESSSAPDTIILRDGLQYPDPQYPNHKPISGNYPGSYTATTPSRQPERGFDWIAAGAGASGMLGLILLGAAGSSATRIARNRRHGIPFVVEVRDATPAAGFRGGDHPPDD
jgi:hypothetical protein